MRQITNICLMHQKQNVFFKTKGGYSFLFYFFIAKLSYLNASALKSKTHSLFIFYNISIYYSMSLEVEHIKFIIKRRHKIFGCKELEETRKVFKITLTSSQSSSSLLHASAATPAPVAWAKKGAGFDFLARSAFSSSSSFQGWRPMSHTRTLWSLPEEKISGRHGCMQTQ